MLQDPISLGEWYPWSVLVRGGAAAAIIFIPYLPAWLHSGKILLRVLAVSSLHYFDTVYAHDVPKTACEFFIPCAYVLCLSSVLGRSCLVLHEPRSDAPGRAKEGVSSPCRQFKSASVIFRFHLLLDTN